MLHASTCLIEMRSTVSTKKILGKYYTSSDLAQAMTDWAVRYPNSKVLDPSFGRGVFLSAASETLARLGATLPAWNLYGVDIDGSARAHVASLLSKGAHETNFLTADFLSLRSGDQPSSLFDVVVGNPPFVRSNQIPDNSRRAAKQAILSDGFKICERAGHWAYFLLHSLMFLKTGGRLAMILPSAFLTAQYSTRIRSYISDKFRKASVLVLNDKWFPDAQESIVILLAEYYFRTLKQVPVKLMNSKRERNLASRLNGSQIYSLKETCKSDWSFLMDRLPSEISVLLRHLIRGNEYLTQLGELATVRIGVVTGANDFFVLNLSKAQELRVPPKNLMPIVKASRRLKGLDYSGDRDENAMSLLVTSSDESSLSESVRAYLQVGKKQGLDRRHKCRTRKPWHLVRRAFVPDAFLHYMSFSVPHVVLNNSPSICTNTIHRLTWKKDLSVEERKAVAVASTTSLAQISFEVQGRSFCGGLLKLEPTKALDVVLPKISTSGVGAVYPKVDQLLRMGECEMAVELSDELMLVDHLGLSPHFAKHMRSCWKTLVDHRKRFSLRKARGEPTRE